MLPVLLSLAATRSSTSPKSVLSAPVTWTKPPASPIWRRVFRGMDRHARNAEEAGFQPGTAGPWPAFSRQEHHYGLPELSEGCDGSGGCLAAGRALRRKTRRSASISPRIRRISPTSWARARIFEACAESINGWMRRGRSDCYTKISLCGLVAQLVRALP